LLALLRRVTWDQWAALHAEHPPARALDWRPLCVLVVAVVSLTAQYYWGDRDVFARLWPHPGLRPWLTGPWDLLSFAWWAGWRVVGYLVVPALVVVLVFGERLVDYGLSPRGFLRHLGVYLGLFAVVAPLVVLVSYTPSFQTAYPFYKLANRSLTDLLVWEALYAAQFLALEFFFRGFLLFGLVRAMGAHAIWVMVVPYVMIHFDKPAAETFGAIVAGLVLGTLALRTRSIWGGVVIHVLVAVSMDVLALRHCPADRPCPADLGAPSGHLVYPPR
jgi:membrane protease YdiL (CAAX protease family)